MTKRVIVIHRSEIVRKGIIAILRNYFSLEYSQFQSISEFSNDNETIENSFLIVFVELFDSIDQSFLKNLQEKNTVKTVGICNKGTEAKNIYGFSNCISINSSSTELAELIADLLNNIEPLSDKKQSSTELSIREKEVLQLVALGNANREIAEKLFISIHTVISHRKNITEKLGIKSISGLTVYAILNNLIDTDSINPEQLI